MQNTSKTIYWLPRILCILAILFISLFALDAFRPGLTFWEQLRDFAIHLIPSYILIALLIVAWKWELIGGIIFILIGLGFSPIIFMHNYRMNQSIEMSLVVILTITFPFVVVGALFLFDNYLRKKRFT